MIRKFETGKDYIYIGDGIGLNKYKKFINDGKPHKCVFTRKQNDYEAALEGVQFGLWCWNLKDFREVPKKVTNWRERLK